MIMFTQGSASSRRCLGISRIDELEDVVHFKMAIQASGFCLSNLHFIC